MKYAGIRVERQRKGKPPKYFAIVTVRGKEYRSEKCDTEREAAIQYDRMRIKHGMHPVNILRSVGSTKGGDVK